MGEVEGQNLIVERYSGEGRPAGFADLAREIVSRNPDAIVPIGPTLQEVGFVLDSPVEERGFERSTAAYSPRICPSRRLSKVTIFC